MATPTNLPASQTTGNVLTAAYMNDLRGAFRVLQVVTGTINSQVGPIGGSYTDVGLSATITPTSNTSKILVAAQINYYNDSTGKSTWNLVRGATQINESNPLGGDVANIDGSIFLTRFDSPATTSATTYKVQGKSSAGGTYFRASGSATCTIFLLEISA